MFTYSVTQWIYGKEGLETSLRRLQRFGYEGVELAGEPERMDPLSIQPLLTKYGLVCTSICGIYTAERDLASPNANIRKKAIQYVKDCVDLADQLGASVVIVVPTPVGKLAPGTTIQEEWKLAVASLREAGEYAETKNIYLAIEALNRYETYLVNTLSTAKQLVQEVNHKYVRIMADLFHMNIEERSHGAALKDIAPYLVHVHIADNTREAAGLGQTDFSEVFHTLLEIGYHGAVTMEFMPPVPNPYITALQMGSGDLYDQYTEQSLDHIKAVVGALKNQIKSI